MKSDISSDSASIRVGIRTYAVLLSEHIATGGCCCLLSPCPLLLYLNLLVSCVSLLRYDHLKDGSIMVPLLKWNLEP